MDNKTVKKQQQYQDHDVDVDSLYQTIISEIDKYRSFTDITDPIFMTGLSNSGINYSELKSSQTYQESRIHAFYRLIGLPVISDKFSNGINYYTPGFNGETNGDVELEKNKFNLFKKFGKDYAKSLTDRESYYNSDIIQSLKKEYIGSYYILTLFNLRKADSAYEKSESTFSNLDKEQEYEILPYDSLGRELSLLKKDDETYISDDSDFSTVRSHLIRPTVVDPRIELTVTPSSKRICQPFLLKQEHSQITKEQLLKKPFIEQIIKERVSPKASNNLYPDFIKQALEYYKKFDSISSDDLFSSITTDYVQDTNALPTLRLLEAIKKIRGLAFVLKSQKEIISTLQVKNFWLPKLNNDNIDSGFSSKELSINDQNLNTFYSKQDQNIVNLDNEQSLKQLSKNISNILNPTTNNTSDFIFDQFLSFLDNEADAYTPDKTKQISDMKKSRAFNIDNGNKALLTIEKIMGEFSGFGLLDAICIITALYVMPKENLLGLLDDESFLRCKTQLSLPNNQEKSNIIFSLEELNKQIHAMYNLSEKIFTDVIILNNNN